MQEHKKAASKRKKRHSDDGQLHSEGGEHHPPQQHGCGEDGCGHGVQEHSLSSGAGEEENPVAALPGLVLVPGLVKAVVKFMAAESPEQVRPPPHGTTVA